MWPIGAAVGSSETAVRKQIAGLVALKMEQLQVRPSPSVPREWEDTEELKGSENREYAVRPGVKVSPRLRMEKADLEAQVSHELGSEGRRQRTVVPSLDSGSPATRHATEDLGGGEQWCGRGDRTGAHSPLPDPEGCPVQNHKLPHQRAGEQRHPRESGSRGPVWGWGCAGRGSTLGTAEENHLQEEGSLGPRYLDLQAQEDSTGPAPLPAAGGSDVRLRVVVVGPPLRWVLW